MCIHDSRTASSTGGSPSSLIGCTLWSTPVMSRTTSNCGWMTRWISCCWRLSSIVTESTRNDMSSVTISTTEWPPADQPWSALLGVKTLTLARPWGRFSASRNCEARAAYTSESERSSMSSAAMCR